jgi:type I restriction enzyme S subunit
LNRNDVHNVSAKIPCPAEQQKIGIYFRTMDELISKHAVQLAKLKLLKSACLEKMFV